MRFFSYLQYVSCFFVNELIELRYDFFVIGLYVNGFKLSFIFDDYKIKKCGFCDFKMVSNDVV